MIKYSIFVILAFIFIGCSSHDCKPITVTEIKYVDRPVTVEVPVKCKITDEVNCDFKGEGFVPTIKLLECVSLQKRIIEQCR